MARQTTDQDPLAIFHTPPPNETPEERSVREAKEAEAKRVSDQIDEQLKADRVMLKKQKTIVRVLLLGQSESGKSTTLKNFRMRYAKDAWDAERASWRSVIQLNLIRSIITIIETLQAEMNGELAKSENLSPNIRNAPISSDNNSSPIATTPHYFSDDHMPQQSTSGRSSSLLTSKHRLLGLRLGPLRRVECDLKKRLGAQAEEEQDGATAAQGSLGLEVESKTLYQHKKEFCVCQLTDALARGLVSQKNTKGSDQGHTMTTDTVVDEVTEVIARCKDDMMALWSDQVVRMVLKNWNVRLEDSAGFFLDDLERIASRSYEPSDDDVVRARLRTLGVQEYKIEFPSSSVGHNLFASGVEFGGEWRLYDVGGSRTVRHAWLPYFDNVQAIIFLAPLSCFDQRLSEDSKINRLEDSFLLWQTICGSKLLAKANMIVFLNKIDLLDRKLRSGVKVKHFLPSYGERINDTKTVVKYLRTKFKDISKEHSTEERCTYYHATTVIDTKATASTIQAVKDTILRDFLKNASFI